MATISIADNDARVQYTQAVTADTTQLTIDFPFFSLDDINVIVTSSAGVDTTLTRGTGTGTFAVVGTSVDDGFSGGYVTLGDTYSDASTKYTIFRDIDVERTTDFQTSGPFNVSSLNTELDKIFAIEQELETKIGRTMKLADSDTAATLSLPNLDTRKGTVLAFNTTTGLPEAGPEIGDVSTIAAITTDIGTLADIEDGTDATDAIQTVAGISGNVTTVAGIDSQVTSVAGKATEIGRLGTADAVADMNTLGTAAIVADMDALADVVADIQTLADIEDGTDATDAIQDVAAIASNVTTVANNDTNITTVAGQTTNMQNVTDNLSAIQNAATNATTATTKASEAASSATSAAASQTAAASSAAALAAALDTFDDKYLGTMADTDTASSASTTATWTNGGSTLTVASASGIEIGQNVSATGIPNQANVLSIDGTSVVISHVATAAGSGAAVTFQGYGVYGAFDSSIDGPSTDNDNGSLSEGMLYFNGTDNEMRVYDGANWIAASAATQASMNIFEYTATASQTTFSGADDNSATLSYTADNLIVMMNGAVLDPDEFTATNGTSVVLDSGAALNDELVIFAFKTFQVADTVSKASGGTFNSSVTVSGTMNATTDVQINGASVSTVKKSLALNLIFGG